MLFHYRTYKSIITKTLSKPKFGGNEHKPVSFLTLAQHVSWTVEKRPYPMFITKSKNDCSTDNIFWTEVKNLRLTFHSTDYPNWLFDKSVEKLLKIKAPRLKDKKNVNKETLFFSVPYFGKSSQLFTKLSIYTGGKFAPYLYRGMANLPPPLGYFIIAPKLKKFLLWCTLTLNQI